MTVIIISFHSAFYINKTCIKWPPVLCDPFSMFPWKVTLDRFDCSYSNQARILLFFRIFAHISKVYRDHRGRDRMLVGFAISAYYHWSCEFESNSGNLQGVLDTILCDKVCQWLAKGWWFSPFTLVSSTNKTDCHNITEKLLKVKHPFSIYWIII